MQKFAVTFCLILTLAVTVTYQGCTPNKFGSTGSTQDTLSPEGNGQGYEGKVSYQFMDPQAPCSTLDSSGQPLPNAQIDVWGPTATRATMTRNQCVAVSQDLNVSNLQFSGAGNTQLVYQNTAYVSANLLVNPSFETGSQPWFLNINNGMGDLVQDATTAAPGGGSASGKMNFTISQGNIWDLCALQHFFVLNSGMQYTVSFWAKGDVAGRPVKTAIAHGLNPFTNYQVQDFTTSTSWQQFTFTYTQPVTDDSAEILICSGQQTGSMWIDMVSITAGPQ